MRKRIIITLLLLTFTGLFASEPGELLNISSSVLIPVDSETNNTTLSIGIGKEFWGIFEFSGNVYMEIFRDKKEESPRIHSPEAYSIGVGANIPMGGFYLKGDYQKFIFTEENSDSYTVVKFGDSYKLGLGIPVTDVLEIEAYYRGLRKGRGTGGYIGVGCIIKL